MSRKIITVVGKKKYGYKTVIKEPRYFANELCACDADIKDTCQSKRDQIHQIRNTSNLIGQLFVLATTHLSVIHSQLILVGMSDELIILATIRGNFHNTQ